MSQTVISLILQSEEVSGNDLEQALEFSREAVSRAREKKLSSELARALAYYAVLLTEKEDKLIVLDYIFEALSLAKEEEDEGLLILCFLKQGTIYLRFGNIDKAFEAYDKARQMGELSQEQIDFSEAYFGLGMIYSYKGDDRKALNFLEKARTMAGEFCNIPIQLKSLNNIGCSHRYLGNWDEAGEYIQQCVEQSREDKYTNTLITGLDELGSIYNKKGDARAPEFWREALDLASQRGSSLFCFSPLMNLASYYFERNVWDEAEKYLNQAKELSKQFISPFDLAEIYELETKFCEARGDYKAALKANRRHTELLKDIQKQEAVWELKNRELELVTENRDRLLVLNGIGRIITSTLDLKKVLSRSYDNLKKILDFSVLGIAQFREETGEILYELYMEEGILYPRFVNQLEDKESIAAWSIRNDRMVHISNFEQERSLYLVGKGKSIGGAKSHIRCQSVIYSPLKIGQKIIGVITIQSYSSNAFSQNDVESFELFSSYAAIALNNAIQAEQIKDQNEALSVLAVTDHLTGLHNRRYFFDFLERFFSLAKRNNLSLSFIMLDLDNFKMINDKYGHPAGDYILREVSEILKCFAKRTQDDSARLGGEEFGLFLGDSDYSGAQAIAEKIREKVEKHTFLFEGKTIPVTISLGVTTNHIQKNSTLTPDLLVKRSDIMLYKAKKDGRNCIRSQEFL
jgi:diguanylate cyclase (GGDEF)-like protein